MLLSTDGLPGPVMMNMFGKPAVLTPRFVRGPAAHLSRSSRPSRPSIGNATRAPVIASKPVAKTMLSNS